MPGLRDLLLGVLLPAILCWVALLVGRRLVEPAGRALAGVAFGAGYLVAHLSFAGVPAWPSETTTPPARDWIAWTVLAATLLAWVPGRGLSSAIRILLAIALGWLSLRTRAGISWPVIAGVCALLAAGTASAPALARRASGLSVPLALIATATGASFANLFSGSALLAQLAGAVAATLGASAAVALRDRRFRLSAPALGIVMLALGGCVLNGALYGQLPAASALLLAGAVFAPWLAELPVLGGPRTWKRVALAVVPAAAAVALAWSPSEPM